MAGKAFFSHSHHSPQKEVWLSKQRGTWQILTGDDELSNVSNIRAKSHVQETAHQLHLIRRSIERSDLDEALRACDSFIDTEAHLSAREEQAEGLQERAGNTTHRWLCRGKWQVLALHSRAFVHDVKISGFFFFGTPLQNAETMRKPCPFAHHGSHKLTDLFKRSCAGSSWPTRRGRTKCAPGARN